MRHGNLFVVSGPSGAGKGTLVHLLADEIPDLWVSVSATTRAPRKGEREGVDYYFKTEEEFKSLIDSGKLLEWAKYSDHCYGTLLDLVREHVEQGDQVVLEIEVQGAFQVREKMPEAVLVFIEPPSFDELEHRLRKRGTEDEDVIEKRLETARVELSQKMKYDIRLVNDDLDATLHQLADYVNERAETKRGRNA